LIVPDPLYIEISTDLLKECAGSTAFPQMYADLILAVKEVLASWRDERRRSAVRDALLHFLKVLANVAAPEIRNRSNLKVWLRLGKREGIRADSIQDIERGKVFNHAAVDGTFYKSSGLIALQATRQKFCIEEKVTSSTQCVNEVLGY
jgi:hypothetical protein